MDAVTRRTLLTILGASTAGAAIEPVAATNAAQNHSPRGDVRELTSPLHFSSATALARAICTKRLSSEEVTRAFLARIRAVNPKIHAVVQVQWEAAIEQARKADARLMRGESPGPLHGVPITIKDSLDTAGIISTAAGVPKYTPHGSSSSVSPRISRGCAAVSGAGNGPRTSVP